MGKLFSSVSSLWVLFIPLITVSKVGIVDLINDCDENSNDNDLDVIMLIKQLGELRQSGLITEEEFKSKKKILLDKLLV
ncbi:SHOCT domain-containing protein [Neobacillus cucumis]|uniref:SHOCT domain-containing protein n=1 Tax=Neobacillus cucumis TaxID=1740721 RepID=UPI0018E040F2|nr:SHOCT domain-containing protein [Neobacillus cucumis]MBI0581371.1 SHOCT domain-containing protein [Neobacillus cucumis]